jgi:chemotaxis protein methyltransferase WspC
MGSAEFEDLLRASIGLDAASIGTASIERAVQERQTACGLPDRHDYWRHVSGSPTERQALIESVVVSETWFFRDREAFTALARIGHEQWLRGDPKRVLRLLSLPCATGEEPYSMAMALLDAGVPADRFRIDAVDISALALAKAEHAVYGRNSFRGLDVSFRDRHFAVVSSGHRPSDRVRRQVQFQRANLLDPGFLPGMAIYHVVFCRNVLIYFDRATQDQAVTVLDRLLTPDGTLFVAPSEAGVLLERLFTSAKIPLAFAFRKRVAPSHAAAPKRARHHTALSTRHPPEPFAAARQAIGTPSTSVPEPLLSVAKPADPQAGLADASRFADQGRFTEAAACCEDHLRRYGPSAETFHLLGLVRDAAGDSMEASVCYRKALYLDPKHYGTLIHFALLHERRGDKPGAQVLRSRALRLEQEGRT